MISQNLLRTARISLRPEALPSSHSPIRSLLRRRYNHTKSSTNPGENVVLEPASTFTSSNATAPPSIWMRLGPVTRLAQAYARSQRNHPLKTQFCSAIVIFALGDLSAQSIGGDEYKPARTVRAMIIGGGAAIPSYKWFLWLGSHFNYSSKLASLGTKVLVNQLVFPPINNTYFFGMQSLLAGDSLKQAAERVKATVPISMLNAVKLWPAVMAFNFTFVPPQYRNLFAGVIAIGWQTYLSYLNRTAELATARQNVLAVAA